MAREKRKKKKHKVKKKHETKGEKREKDLEGPTKRRSRDATTVWKRLKKKGKDPRAAKIYSTRARRNRKKKKEKREKKRGEVKERGRSRKVALFPRDSSGTNTNWFSSAVGDERWKGSKKEG